MQDNELLVLLVFDEEDNDSKGKLGTTETEESSVEIILKFNGGTVRISATRRK